MIDNLAPIPLSNFEMLVSVQLSNETMSLDQISNRVKRETHSLMNVKIEINKFTPAQIQSFYSWQIKLLISIQIVTFSKE